MARTDLLEKISSALFEDVLTSGGSTRETMEVAREKGATVVAAGAVINRSGLPSPVDVPFAALAALTPPTYKPEDCPLCPAGDPVVKPGSRGENEVGRQKQEARSKKTSPYPPFSSFWR